MPVAITAPPASGPIFWIVRLTRLSQMMALPGPVVEARGVDKRYDTGKLEVDSIDAGEVLIESLALSEMSEVERIDHRGRRMKFVSTSTT
jgi:hypothetical protein